MLLLATETKVIKKSLIISKPSTVSRRVTRFLDLKKTTAKRIKKIIWGRVYIFSFIQEKSYLQYPRLIFSLNYFLRLQQLFVFKKLEVSLLGSLFWPSYLERAGISSSVNQNKPLVSKIQNLKCNYTSGSSYISIG